MKVLLITLCIAVAYAEVHWDTNGEYKLVETLPVILEEPVEVTVAPEPLVGYKVEPDVQVKVDPEDKVEPEVKVDPEVKVVPDIDVEPEVKVEPDSVAKNKVDDLEVKVEPESLISVGEPLVRIMLRDSSYPLYYRYPYYIYRDTYPIIDPLFAPGILRTYEPFYYDYKQFYAF